MFWKSFAALYQITGVLVAHGLKKVVQHCILFTVWQ